jgi:predicted secreted protein
MFVRWFAVMVLALFSLNGWADDDTPYNRVSFSAQAEIEVDNDLLVAVMYAEREGRRTDRLANEVNQVIDQAVKRLKREPNIKVRTLAYRTHMIHDKKNKNRWRVHQAIRLESSDSRLLGRVIGELQAELQVQSIDYHISKAQQRRHDQGLTQSALEKFQQRAFEITRSLGMKRYKLVRLSVNGGGKGSPRRVMHDGMRMQRSMAAAPVMLEAGTQVLSVSVNGEIELLED